MLKKIFNNEEELSAFAKNLAKKMAPGTVLFLEGPLGAGKTSFARGILRGFGYEEKVKSPTFSLVESYELPQATIFHFDLYRINSIKELEEIGIHDYFSTHAICLIEWAEKGLSLLPMPDLTCYIKFKNEGREVCFIAHSERGNKIVQ